MSNSTEPPVKSRHAPSDNFFRGRVDLTQRMKTWLLYLSITIVAGVLLFTQGTKFLNQYQSDGELVLDILDEPVTVVRDVNGLPHVEAANKRDMLRAQGFIVAQDRLFQLEMYRAQIWGRLSRYLGEKTIALDTKLRVFGIGRNAEKHAAVLSDKSRQYLQDYVDGLNAYIEQRVSTHPIELKLVGIEPTPWTLTDAVAVLHFINFETAANRSSEVISQQLIDRLGSQRASEVFPINIGPMRDDPVRAVRAGPTEPSRIMTSAAGSVGADRTEISLAATDPTALLAIGFGSNAWAVAPRKSVSGGAILANDPHLDARILPGIWYPMGLSYPGFRAVGAALPGVPGLIIGRNDKVAWSMTNGYGDTQDLYIESVDPDNPDHYLEGRVSIPFEKFVERIQVKDEPDIELTVRSTRRGPVISDHGLAGETDRLISARWSIAKQFSPQLGMDDLFFARSAREADDAVQRIDLFTSNIVFADVGGNIGFRSSGLIPIRANRDGSRPQSVISAQDHWTGWIPKNEMPGEFNPARGWVASANHDVRPDDYPYYYSSYFSSPQRLRRIAELVSPDTKLSVLDHAGFQIDTLNLHARKIAPLLAQLLATNGFEALARQLTDWNHHDTAVQGAPLVFHAIYGQLAREVFSDELGKGVAARFFATRYYWKERFDAMLLTGESLWFDDVRTQGQTETLAQLVVRAARHSNETINGFGSSSTWGDSHQASFVSPLRMSGSGSDVLGGGTHPMDGSNETLLRSTFRIGESFKTRSIDSARIVVDLGDDTKIAGIVPGGHASRQFHSLQSPQLSTWLAGGLNDWWLSEVPESQRQSRLSLLPTR